MDSLNKRDNNSRPKYGKQLLSKNQSENKTGEYEIITIKIGDSFKNVVSFILPDRMLKHSSALFNSRDLAASSGVPDATNQFSESLGLKEERRR